MLTGVHPITTPAVTTNNQIELQTRKSRFNLIHTTSIWQQDLSSQVICTCFGVFFNISF